ncbi:DUF444 family protein [Pseudoduganella sp. LjRoot289]|uniref:DUF444 family protein n=1 Tax=Pseudoduganella sp. LjRoot289 TaxID=3342314 RepID=UPI003ED12473
MGDRQQHPDLQPQRWYALFSRGERDWLRHNDKVREAVRAYLPRMLDSPDLITGPQDRPVKIPLHLLEHARFRLAAPPGAGSGAGRGAGRPGDMLRPGRDDGGPHDGEAAVHGGGGDGEGIGSSGGAGGSDAGGAYNGDSVPILLEFAASDIMDCLWEEMRLPLLEPKPAPGRELASARSGWDTHGAPSQLDRRRTVKQAIRRRVALPAAASTGAPPHAFASSDLRYHQHVARPRAASGAVVLCALDVSASMTLPERKLAKTFFYFALQGLRRKYSEVAVRFIAHTTRAWEFPEQDFFQIAGEGGTQASSAFELAHALVRRDYGGARHNVYLFYASDGENYSEDRVAASQALGQLAPLLNYMGYLETVPGLAAAQAAARDSELRRLFQAQQHAGRAAGISVLMQPEDIWQAIRRFFVHAAAEP